MRRRSRVPLVTRFWPKVEKTDACWLWRGCVNPHGYGEVQSDGDDRRGVKAHRAAWELASEAPIPDGYEVYHVCDTRDCVRNDDVGVYEVNGEILPRRGHLFLGQRRHNVADMYAKERGNTGSRSGAQRHPEQMVRYRERAVLAPYLRARYAAGGTSFERLARDVGISREAVRRAVRGLTWAAAATLLMLHISTQPVLADEGDRYQPSSRGGRAAVEALAEQYFPPEMVGWAVRTAKCESGFDLGAYDAGYDRRYGYYEAIGPWQVAGMWRAKAWELFGGPLEDPDVNAAMAAWIATNVGVGAWPVCGR